MCGMLSNKKVCTERLATNARTGGQHCNFRQLSESSALLLRSSKNMTTETSILSKNQSCACAKAAANAAETGLEKTCSMMSGMIGGKTRDPIAVMATRYNKPSHHFEFNLTAIYSRLFTSSF